MSRLPLFFLAALPFVESPALAAGPIAAEPAPPAQRQAPPDKIAPPMRVPSKALKPETTGEETKGFKPADPTNTRINRGENVPSSPAEAKKCGTEEQKGPGGRCP